MDIKIRVQRRRVVVDAARMLGLVCLLFVTTEVTLAQSDPTVRIHDLTVGEVTSGDNGGLFGWFVQLTLSAPSSKPISVIGTTQAGSATGNADFAAGFDTVTFAPGQTTGTLQVLIKGDALVEGTEEFLVNLSNPVNTIIADGQATVTIVDDDALILLTQTNSQRAVALDSLFLTKEAFPINNNGLFSADNRTRIALYAIGLKLAAGETVTATAEDSQGTVRPLTVEFVGKLANFNFDWLTQVVVKLNDQPTTGDLKIKLSLHGQTSNAVPVAVQSP